MKKKEQTVYTIEREFTSKITSDEMIVRIIKAHMGSSGDACTVKSK